MIRKWRIYAENWTFFTVYCWNKMYLYLIRIYTYLFLGKGQHLSVSELVRWCEICWWRTYILFCYNNIAVCPYESFCIFTQFFCGYEFKEYEYLVSAPGYTKLFDKTLLQWRHMSNFITMTPHECYGVINHWHLDILSGQWCRQSFHVMTLHEWSIWWPLRSILRPLSSCIGSLWKSICSEFACQVLHVYGFCNYIHYNVWN